MLCLKRLRSGQLPFWLAMLFFVPFVQWFLFAALIHGAREPRRLADSLIVASVSVGIAGAMLLALAFEGVICLLMAAPLALALAVMGAVAGHAIQAGRRPRVLNHVKRLAEGDEPG